MQTTIHCKVNARGSIRRFAISEAKFSVLRQSVVSLFGFENADNLTLKYKDEEDQWITFSSDEELVFATQLMGSLLVLSVVEPEKSEKRFVVPMESQERAKKHVVAGNDRVLHRLAKQQKILTHRVASLQASEHPKCQAKAAHMAQKLSAVTAQIDQLTSPTSTTKGEATPTTTTDVSGDVSNDNKTTLPTTATIPTTPMTTDDVTLKPVGPSFDPNLWNQVSERFFESRKTVMAERQKIQSLAAVVQALQSLSQHGRKAECPVLVSAEQIDLAKASLIAAKGNFSAKKEEFKIQCDLFKQLTQQRKLFMHFHRKEKMEKRCEIRKRKEEAKEKKQAWLEAKAQRLADKDRRREEKARWHADKAQRREERKHLRKGCKKVECSTTADV